MGAPQHTPTRMCAACRIRLPKSQARRYALTTDTLVVYDLQGNSGGRGVYVCSQSCYDKIQRGLLPLLTRHKKRENV